MAIKIPKFLKKVLITAIAELAKELIEKLGTKKEEEEEEEEEDKEKK